MRNVNKKRNEKLRIFAKKKKGFYKVKVINKYKKERQHKIDN